MDKQREWQADFQAFQISQYIGAWQQYYAGKIIEANFTVFYYLVCTHIYYNTLGDYDAYILKLNNKHETREVHFQKGHPKKQPDGKYLGGCPLKAFASNHFGGQSPFKPCFQDR